MQNFKEKKGGHGPLDRPLNPPLILKSRQFFIFKVSKRTRMFVLYVKSKVFFIQYKVDT